ncbi:MAG TPA: STAS/SEC14 domain-containing protein [Candidatus Angelobacter sp.]|nr:STAS/SEC14 domain-containing protein [Candidatus Angelobacter sp.]
MASATTYELQAGTIGAIAGGRVRFIEHKGRRILFINYSHCDAALLKAVAEEGHRIISGERLDSVLTLNDVTGTSFDKESVAALQAKVAGNAPYVRRAAVVGISGLQRLIYEGVQAFSKRRIPHFETREEALRWLAQD